MADVGVDESLLKSVAEQVATEAAELVREAWEGMANGRSVAVGTKSADTDVVTAVDHESERLIRARLAELRPGDEVLGEEGGGTAGDGVTWVVDPIDGTVNFLYGLPWFAVSVAAQVDGESVAGAVVEPASGRVWTAARGQGAYLDGRRQ
ncbi:inositol monophosphatase family protein, partial [Amycolatopsis sp. SID8362]|uniref:inositol monophosphatase family protein n=1 Tax=Amycolatopsis sp. SID8362 TaxID=2690346 RepID=UPI00142AB779